MPEIDPELVERAIRWCAEAGRQTTAALTKAALSPLSWDQLLAARALLADPPPARPLGPFALADIARGAPADVAAERERAGRYGAAVAEASLPPASTAPAPRALPGRGRRRVRPPFVVRRASDRSSSASPAPRRAPLLDELLLEEGRAVLGRLLRKHGGKRAPIVESLAAGWTRADGGTPATEDLERLLEHHGMARAFALRERDQLLHALRAAGGVLARAAAEVGLPRAGLEEALDRLGLRGEAERIRERRRQALRARGTLTQRTHLLLDEPEQLEDLGLREEFGQDLAARLPDHLRALTASRTEPPAELLGRSLSLDPRGVERLLQQTGIRLPDVARPRSSAPGAGGTPRTPPRRRPGGAPAAAARGTRPRGPPSAGARKGAGGPASTGARRGAGAPAPRGARPGARGRDGGRRPPKRR